MHQSCHRYLCKLGTAVLMGAVTLALAATYPADAQTRKKKESRDAAMHRCIVAAQRQYPDPLTEQTGRVAVYKACMTQAGYRP